MLKEMDAGHLIEELMLRIKEEIAFKNLLLYPKWTTDIVIERNIFFEKRCRKIMREVPKEIFQTPCISKMEQLFFLGDCLEEHLVYLDNLLEDNRGSNFDGNRRKTECKY